MTKKDENKKDRKTEVRPKKTIDNEKKKKILLFSIIGLVLIGLIWGIVFLVTNMDKNTPENEKVTNPTREFEQKIIKHGSTGKTKEEDQKDARQAVLDLLNSAAKSPEGKPQKATDRIEALENNDFSVMTDETKNKVYFYNEDLETFERTTFQALITMKELLSVQLNQDPLEIKDEEDFEDILVDQQLGIAYVPINSITGGNSIFDMEMIYIDGDWKLAPFSIISQIRLSSVFNQIDPTTAGLEQLPPSEMPVEEVKPGEGG